MERTVTDYIRIQPVGRNSVAYCAIVQRLVDYASLIHPTRLRICRRPARGDLDRRHDRGFSFLRHEIPRRNRDADHQRGQGRQPGGVRRDLKAPGYDRVGMTGE